MFSKTQINFWLDAALLVILMLTFGSGETGGEIHQWLGIAMLAGVALHLILHWKWIVALIRCYSQEMPRPVRHNFWIDVLIAATLVLTIASGLVIALAFPPNSTPIILVELHHNCAALFILSAMTHLALHWKWIRHATKRYVLILWSESHIPEV